MSVLDQVVTAAAAGLPAPVIAERLGLSAQLVATMLDQGERLGLVQVVRLSGCGGPGGPGGVDGTGGCAPADTTACRGCPIAPRERVGRR